MESITAILTGQGRRSTGLTLLKDDTTGLIYQVMIDNGLMCYTQVETTEYYYDKPVMMRNLANAAHLCT